MSLPARALVTATVRATRIFYRLEHRGATPSGPALLAANHPNMLMDPLLALGRARSRVRTIVKAPHFRTPGFAAVLRGVGALPVYRLRDDPRLLARNRRSFRQAGATLVRGGTILIFPEGGSASDPSLRPLKAGAARVALTAEADSGWTLGLKLIPIGLTYRKRAAFRSRALVWVGEPVEVAGWRRDHESDPTLAVRGLTDAMTAGLEAVTLNLARHSDWELVETVDLLQSRRAGLRRPERGPLQERLPRLQRIARRLYRLQARDPGLHSRVVGSVGRFRERQRRLLGRRPGGAAIDTEAMDFRRLWRRVGLVCAGAPLAALGALAWYLPYALTGLVVAVARPAWETTATVKLLTGVILFSGAYVVEVGLATAAGGAGAALGACLALPALFGFALRWNDARSEVQEDLMAWLAIKRRPRAFARLARKARSLAVTLEPLLAESRPLEDPATREVG